MRGLRRLAGPAAAVVTLAVVAPGAAAQGFFEDTNVPARLSGSVVAVWHAAPGACAAVGLCAYSGSITVPLSGTGNADVTGVRGRAFPGTVDLDNQSPAIVRVTREGGGGPDGPSTCVDSLDPQDFIQLEPAAGGRVAVELAPEAIGAVLASGRCAGPLPADLPRLLVSHPVNFRAVGRRPVTIDFSGRIPFAHGPFAGEVVSTLRLGVGRANPRRFDVGPRPSIPRRPRRPAPGPRVQAIVLDYGVESTTGSLEAEFAGLPGPGCAPLDACGAAGRLTYSLGRPGAEVIVFGARRVHGRRGEFGFALLALRQGRMKVRTELEPTNPDTDSPAPGTVAARVALPDGTECRDSVTSPAPTLESAGAREGGFGLVFASAQELGADALRTRCPGPSQADLSGGGALARAAFDPRTLGNDTIDLPLRTGGPLAGSGYGGTRSGEIVLHLRLRHALTEVTREPGEGFYR